MTQAERNRDRKEEREKKNQQRQTGREKIKKSRDRP